MFAGTGRREEIDPTGPVPAFPAIPVEIHFHLPDPANADDKSALVEFLWASAISDLKRVDSL